MVNLKSELVPLLVLIAIIVHDYTAPLIIIPMSHAFAWDSLSIAAVLCAPAFGMIIVAPLLPYALENKPSIVLISGLAVTAFADLFTISAALATFRFLLLVRVFAGAAHAASLLSALYFLYPAGRPENASTTGIPIVLTRCGSPVLPPPALLPIAYLVATTIARLVLADNRSRPTSDVWWRAYIVLCAIALLAAFISGLLPAHPYPAHPSLRRRPAETLTAADGSPQPLTAPAPTPAPVARAREREQAATPSVSPRRALCGLALASAVVVAAPWWGAVEATESHGIPASRASLREGALVVTGSGLAAFAIARAGAARAGRAVGHAHGRPRVPWLWGAAVLLACVVMAVGHTTTGTVEHDVATALVIAVAGYVGYGAAAAAADAVDSSEGLDVAGKEPHAGDEESAVPPQQSVQGADGGLHTRGGVGAVAAGGGASALRSVLVGQDAGGVHRHVGAPSVTASTYGVVAIGVGHLLCAGVFVVGVTDVESLSWQVRWQWMAAMSVAIAAFV